MFVCKKIEGEYYLLTDLNNKCYDTKWYTWTPLAIMGIFLYPINI